MRLEGLVDRFSDKVRAIFKPSEPGPSQPQSQSQPQPQPRPQPQPPSHKLHSIKAANIFMDKYERSAVKWLLLDDELKVVNLFERDVESARFYLNVIQRRLDDVYRKWIQNLINPLPVS